MNSASQSQTEHLSLVELLGGNQCFDKPPVGWKHPKAIAKLPPDTEVYVKNLRSGEWERGIIKEYWQRGSFLEVLCGSRLQKVFAVENVVTKQILLMM